MKGELYSLTYTDFFTGEDSKENIIVISDPSVYPGVITVTDGVTTIEVQTYPSKDSLFQSKDLVKEIELTPDFVSKVLNFLEARSKMNQHRASILQILKG